MSLLDANLYTLLIRPSPTDPKHLAQLIEPSRGSEVRYLRYRGRLSSTPPAYDSTKADGEDPTVAFGGYDASLVDAHTSVRLASCSSAQPSYKAKKRRLELHNPDMSIPFEFSGSLGFEWQFTYEEKHIKWSRPAFGSDYVCAIDRKPDPSVQICVAKPPAKGKDGVIQLLDYNISRFDFQDLKGLELAIYMSLLAIIDAAEDKMSSRKEGSPPQSRAGSTAPPNTSTSMSPSQETASDSAELLSLQALNFNADPNEIYIPATGPVGPHVSRCVDLLGDDSLLFLVLRSATPDAVRKVVEVADAAKRARHRMGLDQEGRGLFQYVIEDESDSSSNVKKTGPRVIQLDDVPIEKERKYTPPQRIAIYLSKIEMPELQPKSTAVRNSFSAISGSESRSPRNGHSGPHIAPTPQRRLNQQGNSSPSVAPPLPEKKKSATSAAKESVPTEEKASRIGRLFRSKS